MPDPSLNTPKEPRMDGVQRPLSYAAGDTDTHGRAALLLVESLIHALVDKAVITQGEAIDVIDIASEVEVDIAGPPDGHDRSTRTQLAPLAKTFRVDSGE